MDVATLRDGRRMERAGIPCDNDNGRRQTARRRVSVSVSRGWKLGWVLSVAVLASMPALSGCNGFFVCQGKASCPNSGSTTTTNTGDFGYFANNASSSAYVTGYQLSGGSLSALTGVSPYTLAYTPVAMTITPSNAYLYVASTSGLIYGFSISSSGALSTVDNGVALGGGGLYSSTPVSMAVSPDGYWLYVADSGSSTFTPYLINTSNGYLTPGNAYQCNSGAAPQKIAVAPTNKWVVCVSGTAGDAVYPISSSSSTSLALGTASSITTGSGTTGDYAAVMDSNDDLFVARSGSLVVYALDSNPTSSVTSQSVGVGPRAIALDSTKTYVYDANYADGTISGFSISGSGTSLTLTKLAGSPFTAPANVSALAADNSGKYLLAMGFSSTNGVQMYSLSSGVPSAVTSNGTQATSTSQSEAPALALTH